MKLVQSNRVGDQQQQVRKQVDRYVHFLDTVILVVSIICEIGNGVRQRASSPDGHCEDVSALANLDLG